MKRSIRNGELILLLGATALSVSLAMISVQGQATGAAPVAPAATAPPAAQATEFGQLRATGPAAAPRRGASAISDVQATVLQQIELESYKEIEAMTNAVNELRTAAYSFTPSADRIRATAASLTTAQLAWGLKTAELFSRIQASAQRLTPAAVNEHVSTVGSGARRGGGRRGGPTFTEPQVNAMLRLVQDSSAEAAAVTNALIAFRTVVYAVPANQTELRSKADLLNTAQLAWALKASELLTKMQSSAQKLPEDAIPPLVAGTVSTLVPTATPAQAPPPAAGTNTPVRGAPAPAAGGAAQQGLSF